MSLTTPDKIRSLQRKLYCKAKAEPTFRFYLLYDKICREDILVHAYRLARVNAGAPGVDGMTFARIEEQGLEAWLAGLRAELVSKTYRPDPVRRDDPQSEWWRASARHSDAPGIMHLIQFALGMPGGDDLSSRPNLAAVDRRRRRF